MQSTARPRIFVSYSHDSASHAAGVRTLTERLIAAGCECVLDQYESHPAEGWPQWMDRQLDEADFVLVVCTESYYRKAKHERSGSGHGSRFESILIVQELYDAGMWNNTFIPVLFDDLPNDLILRPLRGFTRYRLDQPQGFEDLLRHLTGQPRHVRPPLGSIPALPPDPPAAAAADRPDAAASGGRTAPDGAPVPSGGAGPRLHNLPFPSLGQWFQGREIELAEMGTALAPWDGEGAPLRELVLHGLGGVGKTQLAVEHAWRAGDRHRAAFFVRGESAEGLQAELAGLAAAELLDLPARRERAEDEATAAVLRWLRANPGWLLIIDNADSEDAAQAVIQLLPRLHGGQVLLTSRIAVWPIGMETCEVLPISPESATRFLLERTARARQPAADDRAAAGELAEKLGGLPLALEQAAAYIGYHRITLRQYLTEWKQSGVVLAWYDAKAMRYPQSLAVTWQTTIERLSHGARALLRLVAHLAADPIPVEMLFQSAAILEAAVTLATKERESAPGPAGSPPAGVAAGVAELAAFSMIERGDTGVVAHRLVQEVTRARIPHETRREWAQLAVSMVYGYAPADSTDVRTWPVWNTLRSHALEAIGHANQASAGEPTPRLATALGLLLSAKGLNRDAEPVLRTALTLAENLYGIEDPSVAAALINLTHLLMATGRPAEAEPLARRALAIDERTLGSQHPSVARDLSDLASVFGATNRLGDAEVLMRRALALSETIYGPENSLVASILSNLAMLLKDLNRLAEAEPLIRRALAIHEAAYGPEHPNVATALNNLAALVKETNRLAEAEKLMRRALAILETAYGAEHPAVATLLSNLAMILKDANRLPEAEGLVLRALAIHEGAYGPENRSVATDLNNLAVLLDDSRRAEAEGHLRRALAINEIALGSEHPTVARTLNNLAMLLAGTNRLGEAESALRRSLAIVEASFGPDHPAAIERRANLARLSRLVLQQARASRRGRRRGAGSARGR